MISARVSGSKRCNNSNHSISQGRKNRNLTSPCLVSTCRGNPINIPGLRETNGLFPVFVVPETCATRKLFGSEQVPAQAQPFPQPRRCFFRICSRGSALRGHGSEEKVQSRLKVESGWLAMGRRVVMMTRHAGKVIRMHTISS